MPAKTAPTEDIWHGVQDPKKRKQIQDRLAQRARRRRLAEGGGKSKKPSSNLAPEFRGRASEESLDDVNSIAPPGSSSELQLFSGHSSSSQQQPQQPQAFQQQVDGLLLIDGSSSGGGSENEIAVSFPPINNRSTTSSDPYKIVPILLDHELITMPNNGACQMALTRNGKLMGLRCSDPPSKSKPQPPDVPGPLQPSRLQLETVHPQWIDRFPFVRFRDNFVSFSAFINLEEFLEDFFTMQTFSLAPGKPTWDPSSWYIHRDYYAKWGWLFFWPPEKQVVNM